MRNSWVVVGSPDNWRRSFASNGIWGLRDRIHDKVFWLALAPGDLLFFYVSGAAKRVVGYGTARTRFVQDTPLWAQELKAGRALWPLRFEFDVDFLLPETRWEADGVHLEGGGAFRQPLILQETGKAASLLTKLNPECNPDSILRPALPAAAGEPEANTATHREVQNVLVETGRLQNYLASSEYLLGSERLDVVWRRLPESVPTYVFEVQIGGDVYHALGKLKHAHDIWNSRIFLVASADGLNSATQLLAGTFHEIQREVHLIATERILRLHASKRSVYEVEKEMGIAP